MSHGITDNDTMLSVRESPWHGLGVVLEKRPKSIHEVLKIAKLDWSVSKEPIFVKTGSKYLEVPGHFAIMRDRDKAVLGTVTDRYEPVQNIEAFQFLDAILGELIVETAGSLWNGRIVWLMSLLPDYIEVGGDKIAPYIYVRTTHDGSGAVQVINTPVRVVCKNTDTAAMNMARATYSVRHLSNASAEVAEARKVLGLSINYFKQFEKVGNRFASKKITERKLKTIMAELYPMEDGLGDRAVRNREDAYNTVLMLFKGIGPNPATVGNAPGSAWSAYNAITEWRDHYSNAQSLEGVFKRQMDDPAQVKQRAFQMIADAVGVTV